MTHVKNCGCLLARMTVFVLVLYAQKTDAVITQYRPPSVLSVSVCWLKLIPTEHPDMKICLLGSFDTKNEIDLMHAYAILPL